MRIRVIWEGKTKDAHLRALQADFAARIARFNDFAIEELHRGKRSARQAAPGDKRWLQKFRGSTRVFLDERGREWSSQEFAEWLGRQALTGTRDVVFFVGGREGLSDGFRKEADVLLALSRLTLTRDWARTLLLEQIYRGFTILRGYPYAR